jgi:hypothetical protein
MVWQSAVWQAMVGRWRCGSSQRGSCEAEAPPSRSIMGPHSPLTLEQGVHLRQGPSLRSATGKRGRTICLETMARLCLETMAVPSLLQALLSMAV